MSATIPFTTSSSGNPNNITNASYVLSYPVNSYQDFLSTVYSGYVVHVGDVGFKALDYFELIVDGIVQSGTGVLINNNGQPLISGHTFANYGGNNNVNPQIRRICGTPQKQQDQVNWVDGYNEIYKSTVYTYVVLQMAIPVTQYMTLDSQGNILTTTTLGVSSTTSITAGNIFQLSNTLSRGKEKGSSWSFQKIDPSGAAQPVTAILGVDYTLTQVSATNINVNFINTAFNYSVALTCSGYTFADNPWLTFPNDPTPNTNTNVYYFNLVSPTATYKITVPKINILLSVPASALVGTNPFETYQNQDIAITPQLDLTTGSWIKQVAAQADVVLTKSLSDWVTEISNTCNVILEVRDKTTNNLLMSVPGLSPTVIKIPIVSRYTLNYITQKK